MDKYDFGKIAEEEVCYREQQIDDSILYTESSSYEDRKKYDRKYIYKTMIAILKEMKCDLMSHRNKRAYIEKHSRYKLSGLSITEALIWNHTFVDGDTIYCVEYLTEFLREKLKDRKLEILPNYTAGNYLYFTEIFEDVKNGNAKLVFKEDKQVWIKAIQARGGMEVNQFLQEIDETLKVEEEQEVKMGKFNIRMAGGLVAEIEGRINRILDMNGVEVVSSYSDVVATPAPKPKPARASKPSGQTGTSLDKAVKYITENLVNGTQFTTKDVMAGAVVSDQVARDAIRKMEKDSKFSFAKQGPMSARTYTLVAVV